MSILRISRLPFVFTVKRTCYSTYLACCFALSRGYQRGAEDNMVALSVHFLSIRWRLQCRICESFLETQRPLTLNVFPLHWTDLKALNNKPGLKMRRNSICQDLIPLHLIFQWMRNMVLYQILNFTSVILATKNMNFSIRKNVKCMYLRVYVRPIITQSPFQIPAPLNV